MAILNMDDFMEYLFHDKIGDSWDAHLDHFMDNGYSMQNIFDIYLHTYREVPCNKKFMNFMLDKGVTFSLKRVFTLWPGFFEPRPGDFEYIDEHFHLVEFCHAVADMIDALGDRSNVLDMLDWNQIDASSFGEEEYDYKSNKTEMVDASLIDPDNEGVIAVFTKEWMHDNQIYSRIKSLSLYLRLETPEFRRILTDLRGNFDDIFYNIDFDIDDVKQGYEADKFVMVSVESPITTFTSLNFEESVQRVQEFPQDTEFSMWVVYRK